MTWNDLITLAFEDLAVIQPGEPISTAMQTDAQSRLNALIGSLNTEGATVFNQVMQTFTLTAGTTAYTLGSGGTLATTGGLRAQKVTAWRAFSSTTVTNGGAPLSMAEFGAAVGASDEGIGMQSVIPKFLGADTAYASVNIRIWPPPSSSPGSLELAYWTPISQISDFTASISLPDGWIDMLHFNLAVRLAPLYARQGGISQELAANAQNTKAALVSQNQMTPAAPGAQQ
ncbi:MAG TPA: hypothetical protein VGF59_25935 [Bryobacteraceae bacterium]|jgi:hypothetical protein